jgi:folate-binding protein YgfZ
MIQLLKNRAILSVTGDDSLMFLQNLTTNDLINNLYSYNYLLSTQGRYLYDFFVLKFLDNKLFIDIDSASSQSFLKKLNLYKLRKDIEIQDVTTDYCILYSKEKLEISDVVLSSNRDPRFFKLGFRSLVKSLKLNELELVSDDLYIKDKYEYTIPDGITDLSFDNSMVSQFGAEELSAVSFSKGCYIGQEVISRAKYQGSIRKKLFKLQSGTKIASNELGMEITDLKSNKIGVFCSSYNDLGIALLSYEKYLGLNEKIAIINNTEEVLISQPEWI